MKYVCLLYILNIFFSVDFFSQENRVRFEHLTINDGLSQSSVHAIYQDSFGFMWFGTDDGLNRYDGYNFKIFKNDPYDSTSLIANIIVDITEDRNGNLWIATSDGLCRYNRDLDIFKQIHISRISQQNYNSDKVYSLLIPENSASNKVWFSTLDGVYNYNDQNGRLEFYNIIGGKETEGIDLKVYLHEDKNEGIWAITNMFGIYKLNPSENRFTEIIPKNTQKEKLIQLSPVYEDSNGLFWFGSVNGLCKYNPQTNQITFYKSQIENALNKKMTTGFINSIVENESNELFLATGGYGLLKFNKENFDISVYQSDLYNGRSLSFNVVNRVFVDKSGVLWIGTDGGGIDKLSPYLNNFNSIHRTEDGLSILSVRTFFEDAYGKLWISGYNGLDRYDYKTNQYENLYEESEKTNSRKLNEVVYKIIEDKNHPNKYLYLGTEGKGVYRYNFKTKLFRQIFYSNSSYGENLIYSLYDDGNNIWIGTSVNLIQYNKKDGGIKKFAHDPNDSLSISPKSITDIFEDSKGNLWIGTDQGGLNLMDRQSETFSKFVLTPSISKRKKEKKNENKSMRDDFVKCIFEDSRGMLWIGTTNGLNKVDFVNRSVKKFSVKDGLPNNVIYGILEDSQGRLWMSTNNGLSCFDVEMESFQNYDYLDGLQSNEFNTNAYYKTRDGKLLFGGINGFNSFDPDKIKVNSSVPSIVLTKFSLFNEIISAGEEINGRVVLNNSITSTDTVVLNYNENIFSIEFASLDYSAPGNNEYSYQLIGFNEEFSLPSTDRTVTYTNLDPGEYIFDVIGSNSDGVWDDEGTQLLIIITPPFWLTWWFFVIVFIFVVTVIYALYKYRINKILELERLRIKIASDLHDEVGSTLTKVSMRAQMLELQTKDSDKAVNLRRIAEQAREAVSTMRDIVWSIDSRNDTFGDLITKIKDTAYSLLTENGIKLQLNIDGLKDSRDISVNFRQNVYLILKEALNNIAKHSDADNVKIDIINSAAEFRMSIKDNGTTFDEKDDYSGQGLKNMKMRADKINGIINFEFNDGFIITLSIPSKS